MCGIAGIHAPGGEADPQLVAAMVRRLVHRGPDGDGFFDAAGVALGMRRLAIIDPEHGHQPLRDESGDVVAVFNGELYNHAELRTGLEARGHRLRSGSDGEVIPHLYEEETASSPLRCGTGAPTRCTWPATASGSSRCTGRGQAGTWRSRPRSRRCWPIPPSRARWTWRRWTASSPSASSPRR